MGSQALEIKYVDQKFVHHVLHLGRNCITLMLRFSFKLKTQAGVLVIESYVTHTGSTRKVTLFELQKGYGYFLVSEAV